MEASHFLVSNYLLSSYFSIPFLHSILQPSSKFWQENNHFSDLQITTFEGPFEIVSLVGTLSGGEGHLHISLSDKNGKVIGGHVIGDLDIYTTAEIVLGECENTSFLREYDSETGYDELVVYHDEKATA